MSPTAHLGLALHLVRWVERLPPGDDYLVLFAIACIEGAGMPGVPFEPIFLGIGYLIAGGRLVYLPAVLSGSIGSLTGNLVGYAIGRLAGDCLGGEAGVRIGLTPERIARVQAWFARWGGRTIFIGRWFGPIRTPAILAAGFTRMDLVSYTAWSALGAFSWVGLWLLVTWRFGGAAVLVWQRYGWHALLVLAVIVVLAYFAATRLRTRRGAVDERRDGGL